MDAVKNALRIAKQEGGPLATGNDVAITGSPTGTVDQPAAGDVGVQQTTFNPTEYVTGLYKNVLNRDPDVGGLQNWVQSLQQNVNTPQTVRESFLASPENTVQDLYSVLLKRSTLDPGSAGWVNALQSGEMTPAQIREAIMQSEEYRGLTGQKGDTAQDAAGQAKNVFQFPDKPSSSSRMMPLVYKPPAYKDYGATTSAYRVAYGLENLPEGFRSYSPTLPNKTQAVDADGNPIISSKYGDVGTSDLYDAALKKLLGNTGGKTDNKGTGGTGGTSGGGGGTGGLSYADDIANLYRTYLGRDPEAGAISNWDAQIKSGQMSFADVLNQIKSSPEGQVNQAYVNLLGRRPEEGALMPWVEQLTSGSLSPQQFQQAITSSPEYVSNQIANAYKTYLNRAPDSSEVSAWAANVLGGGMSLPDVIGYISGSPEARGFNTGGAVKSYADGGLAESELTDYENLVRAAYKGFLRREPDEGGFYNWVGALESGAISPQDFESQFKSAGYEDDVINAYQKYLNRLPESEEVGAWINTLDAGMPLYEFIQSVQRSPEATSRSYYENVPEIYKTSPVQDGRRFDIDIGRVERSPRLEYTLGPVNLGEEVERLKKIEAEATAAENAKNERERGSLMLMPKYGNDGGGGGGGDGTAGGLGDTAGGGGYGSESGNADSAGGSPAGDGGGSMGGAMARGGNVGNDAITNALRLIKADRR